MAIASRAAAREREMGEDLRQAGGMGSESSRSRNPQPQGLFFFDELEAPVVGGIDGPQAIDPTIQQVCNSAYAATRLEGESEMLLVDTGTKDNVTGRAFIEKQDAAAPKGHPTIWKRLPKPKQLAGVGNGTQKCTFSATVHGVDDQGRINSYTSQVIDSDPVAEESSELPALYGMDPMARRNTFVGTRQGVLHEVPAGLEDQVIWPIGTVHRQCTRAPSGHLMLPLGKGAKVRVTKVKEDGKSVAESQFLKRKLRREERHNQSVSALDQLESQSEAQSLQQSSVIRTCPKSPQSQYRHKG